MKRIILITLLILIVFPFIYSYFIEPNFLFIQNMEIDTTIEKGIKVVIFSDIHIGRFKNGVSLSRIVDRVNALKPDIILIPGDFVFQVKDFKELNHLSKLDAQVVAVLGNHDVGFPGENVSQELSRILKNNNVQILDNTITKINDSGVIIIGLSDLYQGNIDFTLLENQEETDFVIVLVHNPDAVFSFPNNSNVDLVVSGHTHGGQIRVPFLYKQMIPTKYDFNKGLYKINNIDVVVTSGVGMSTLPFRFLIPPEIIFLKID